MAEGARALFLLVLLGFPLSGCSSPAQSEEAPAVEKKEAPATNVRTLIVTPRSMTEHITLSGGTIADKDVTHAAEKAGKIEYLAVDYGDRVKKGQLLARIDTAMAKAQRDQAKASYELAEKTLLRLQKLRTDDLISQQQLDEAETRKISAKAALDIAEVNLDQSQVYSTVDGFVARRYVERGEYVGPGQAIVQIVDFKTIVITADLPENQVPLVKRGQPVTVRIDALGEEFQGNIYVVMPAAHPVSRTFEIRIKVPNPDYKILVGMAARVSIASQVHENAIVVPQDAVIEEKHRRTVFVAKDGIAEQRTVELGPTENNRVLLLSGVAPGDALIVEGHRDIFAGQPIRVISQ